MRFHDFIMFGFIAFLISALYQVTYGSVVKKDVIKVFEYQESYDFHIKGKGNLNNLQYFSCHRSRYYKNAGNVETEVWWWTKTKKDEFVFTYKPTEIERDSCPLILAATSKSLKQSNHYYDFKGGKYNLRATIHCNGKSYSDGGVTICEAKRGLVQMIEFTEKVNLSSDCLDKAITGKKFPLKVIKDRCIYTAQNKTKRLHKFTLLAFDEVVK